MSDLSPEAQALLRRVAASDDPTRADRDRVLGLVVAATAVPVIGDGGASTGGAAAGVAGGGALKLVVLFAVSVGVGGVATTAATRAMRAPPPPAPIVAPRAVAAPAPPPAPAPSPVLAMEPEPVVAAPVVKPSPPPRKVESTPEIPAPVAAPPPALPRKEDPCSLPAELQVVQQAQQALTSRPAEAVAALDRFAGACPSGTLVEERLATRGLALCLAGQRDEGRAAADALAERFPQSSALARVRQACGQ